jgi:hypothetical protein
LGIGVVLILMPLTGCGPERESGPKLTGKVLINGQPCRPASLYDFDIKFISVEEGPIKKSYTAAVEEDGTFSVTGSIGKGIPPALYKVSVLGPVIDASGKTTRKYLTTYSDKTTPLEIDIKPEHRELIIDLEKQTAELH